MRQLFRRLLVAAALTTAAATAAVAQDKPLRIGFVSHQHDITDLFGQLEIGFREALDAKGIKYELFQAAPTASNRHDEMLNILENMANLNLDYMVFGPSSLEQNTPGLVTVAGAGTKILMVDYEPKEGSSFPFEDAVLNWSVYNHGQMGEATGRWIAEHLKSQGKDSADVIMIWGPIASEISQDRGNGVLKGMEEVDGFTPNIIYDGYGDFQREKAYAEVERALIAYPSVEVIVGMNSVMAAGFHVRARGRWQARRRPGDRDGRPAGRAGDGRPREDRCCRVPRSAQHGRKHRQRPDHAPGGAGGGDPASPLYGSANPGFG